MEMGVERSVITWGRERKVYALSMRKTTSTGPVPYLRAQAAFACGSPRVDGGVRGLTGQWAATAFRLCGGARACGMEGRRLRRPRAAFIRIWGGGCGGFMRRTCGQLPSGLR